MSERAEGRELLTCPFCGSAAKVEQGMGNETYISCSREGCAAESICVAIDADWNRRAPVAAQDNAVAQDESGEAVGGKPALSAASLVPQDRPQIASDVTTGPAAAAPPPAPLARVEEPTDGYVQPVPDRCDRIVWRGRYIHLPILAPEAREREKS